MFSRVAIITGATKGIGHETAKRLASEGWSISICSSTSGHSERIASELAASFGVATYGGTVDVADRTAVANFAKNSKQYLGSAQVIINSAAVYGPIGGIEQLGSNNWRNAININLSGASNVIGCFYDQLEDSGNGRVINFSGGGVGGDTLLERSSAYVVSKFAIAGLTEILSKEMEAIGATINAIAPGAVPTSFMDGVLNAGEEVSGSALFSEVSSRQGKTISNELEGYFTLLDHLLSPESSNINGRILSARWDIERILNQGSEKVMDNHSFRFRRIDGDLYGALQ